MPFEAYYDIHPKTYWLRDKHGEFIELTERNFERRLLQQGGVSRNRINGLNSTLDNKILEYQWNHAVSYAGPLAGCKAGVQEISGRRILVTSSPMLIEPKPGAWPVLRQFLENLSGPEQLLHVYGWLRCAVEAVRSGRYRPGQALAIAGPADCGKSLFQGLVTEILCGRKAKPYRYMSEGTEFNSDLFGAEHLMIEDEMPHTDLRRRRAFGAHIKNVAVNQSQSCHAKGRPALTLTPCWRLTVSVNDEPENLLIFPPIDDSVADKLILLKGYNHPMPMPTGTLEERAASWTKLVSELPAFLDFLAKWEIPVELRSERFGITHYHHPELLAAINELAPEEELLRLIDATLFEITPAKPEWTGTALELEDLLTQKESAVPGQLAVLRDRAKRLLNWPNALVTYLGRLRKRYPDWVEYTRTESTRTWRIKCGQPRSDQPTPPSAPSQPAQA